MSDQITRVDVLITKAIATGEFADENAAAEAIHEWLLHHKQLHCIHKLDITKTTVTPKSAEEEVLDDGKFQLEVMRNQDA